MRHTVAKDYVDIDMVNALLLFVCEQLKMKETHARIAGNHLNQYELYKEERITKGEKTNHSIVHLSNSM